MSKLDIKFAQADDIPQLISLAYATFKDSKLEELGQEVDEEKLYEEITDSVLNQVVLVKRNDLNNKKIDGVLSLQISQAWFSKNPILMSTFFFIKPEVRSFSVAKSLLNAAQEYAIINKLPIVFDIFVQKDAEKKKKLLKYLGFKDFGSSFVFVP